MISILLWVALPLQAATNVKLNGVMPAFGDVSDFQISRDGRYAVYRVDQDTDTIIELYLTFEYFLHLPLLLRQG